MRHLLWLRRLLHSTLSHARLQLRATKSKAPTLSRSLVLMRLILFRKKLVVVAANATRHANNKTTTSAGDLKAAAHI